MWKNGIRRVVALYIKSGYPIIKGTISTLQETHIEGKENLHLKQWWWDDFYFVRSLKWHGGGKTHMNLPMFLTTAKDICGANSLDILQQCWMHPKYFRIKVKIGVMNRGNNHLLSSSSRSICWKIHAKNLVSFICSHAVLLS